MSTDDLDQAALDCLQQVTTHLDTWSMPLAQRRARAQNAIRDSLAAVRAEERAQCQQIAASFIEPVGTSTDTGAMWRSMQARRIVQALTPGAGGTAT